MESRFHHGEAFSLRAVTVRPTRGAAERCRRDTLRVCHTQSQLNRISFNE